MHTVPYGLIIPWRGKLGSGTAEHSINSAPGKHTHTHTQTLPQAALCIHREMGGVENANQPELFGWRNSHEYNRDILWDNCLKEFKYQCWYLLVVL